MPPFVKVPEPSQVPERPIGPMKLSRSRTETKTYATPATMRIIIPKVAASRNPLRECRLLKTSSTGFTFLFICAPQSGQNLELASDNSFPHSEQYFAIVFSPQPAI